MKHGGAAIPMLEAANKTSQQQKEAAVGGGATATAVDPKYVVRTDAKEQKLDKFLVVCVLLYI